MYHMDVMNWGPILSVGVPVAVYHGIFVWRGLGLMCV